MRTTQSQQTKTQRSIIRAAVDLITQHGFDGTTMKQIARAAGVGDATIYNYFPTKDRLVLGYFEQAFGEALAATQATPDLSSFSLQEHMQLLIDSVLDVLQPDREFVATAKSLAERTPGLMLSTELPGKSLLKQAFSEMLTHAETSGEIPPCGFKASLCALLADSMYGLIAYWLRDTSDAFGNTTQLVDLSLGTLVLALKSGIGDKLLDLGGFVIRSHLARVLQNGSGLLDLVTLARKSWAAHPDQQERPAPPKSASSKRKKGASSP